ncbi:alpha/beta hydrolase [Devosia sp. FKR38]|uniref:alpha/beta fold hydrolase n=1 Tax=Devosia sp. FKR38 TaxID=2562312 RepID=UPI0010C02276|nr:alpha/beta hydrolase [Devosia sp. FKR38]
MAKGRRSCSSMADREALWTTPVDDVFEPSQFRLLVPSRPGYRGTPLAGKTTPRDAAALGAALLDEVGIEKTMVVGVSLGGRAAIEFAASFPERTRALVLGSAISGPWYQPPDPIYVQSKRLFSPRREWLV